MDSWQTDGQLASTCFTSGPNSNCFRQIVPMDNQKEKHLSRKEEVKNFRLRLDESIKPKSIATKKINIGQKIS